ncbi:MAG: hypothetical protein HY420_02130 [Candidatus Kerfeldbacteria bacterium]|nr:hypothetical protein [Candidatus Kerfeldbacteria bacterium]
MKTKDDLLRELDLEEMQQFLLVATPQKRHCAICGRETWRPRFCSRHEGRQWFRARSEQQLS